MGLRLIKRGGIWHAEGTLNGQRIRRSLKTECKVVAEEARVQMELRALRGLSVAGAGKTFVDACNAYLARPEPISKTHWLQVERLARGIGPVPIEMVREAHVHEWAMREMAGAAQATVRRVVTTFNTVMAKAQELGWTEQRVIAKRPPDGLARTRWLTEEELRELLRHMPEHVWPFYVFMSQTGARAGELVALDWSDVLEMPGGELAVVLKHIKGNTRRERRRQVPLNGRAVQAIKEQARLNGQASVPLARRKGAVFRNMVGERWSSPAGPSVHFDKAVEAAGLEDVQPHDLRRTFASTLVQRGVNLKAVAELLGHSDMAMVSRYAHLAPSQHMAAVNML